MAALAVSATGAVALECGSDGANFDAWLGRFRREAAAQGISANAIQSGLADAGYDSGVIGLDRGQRSFKLSFEDFYKKRVSTALINKGRRLMQTHKATLDRIEQRYGVPGSILMAIWGLETNYGGDGGGGRSIIKSLATLAYDCRRSAFFQNELMSALRIIDRGDMSPAQLRGGWAGEIGPMQFLPSSYVKYAVDFDGDGRRDLMRSVPDMLASTANFLKGKGWQAGKDWTPGSPNWTALQEWNKAEVYQKTIAIMATKIDQK